MVTISVEEREPEPMPGRRGRHEPRVRGEKRRDLGAADRGGDHGPAVLDFPGGGEDARGRAADDV